MKNQSTVCRRCRYWIYGRTLYIHYIYILYRYTNDILYIYIIMVFCTTRFAIYALPKTAWNLWNQQKSQADRARRSLAAQMPPPAEKQHLLSWSCFAKLIVFFTVTGKNNHVQKWHFFNSSASHLLIIFRKNNSRHFPAQSGSAFLQPQLQPKARHNHRRWLFLKDLMRARRGSDFKTLKS